MALSVGDWVSMSLAGTIGTSGLGPIVQAQPPKFGRVAVGAGGPPFTSVTVLWEDGRFEAGIAVGSLDQIGAPDASVVTEMQGRFVQTDPALAATQESPEYQGTVVTLYTRAPNGTGATGTLVLMFTNVGTYREVLASSLAVDPSR